MTPRLARPEEAEPIRALVRAAYLRHVPRMGAEPGPMGDDYAARIARAEAWVLEAGARIEAVLVIEDDGDALLIDNVAVAPEAQGAGRGTSLLAFAEAEARRRGHARLCLYTHETMVENIALYARRGFRETHRAVQTGFARVFMEKQL